MAAIITIATIVIAFISVTSCVIADDHTHF